MNQAKAKAKIYPISVLKNGDVLGLSVLCNSIEYGHTFEVIDYESFRTVCEALKIARFEIANGDLVAADELIHKALKDVGYE